VVRREEEEDMLASVRLFTLDLAELFVLNEEDDDVDDAEDSPDFEFD